MISSCLANGSWSPINLECEFDPAIILDSLKNGQSFDISHMNMSSMIIIGILSGIILLLLALIVICFHCHKTCSASNSKMIKTKLQANDEDNSVSMIARILEIIPFCFQHKCGVIVYDDLNSPHLVESDYHTVLDNYSIQSPHFHKSKLTTFNS